ncbi:hypothetical protein GCM10023189_20180 [Nibrella saemangeumensis]|uniref:Uncharacterized protein n=1 Tax=Nibrella saemangeumensis TaxID=1084526 RepID=A0ABP8MPX2_9BACT
MSLHRLLSKLFFLTVILLTALPPVQAQRHRPRLPRTVMDRPDMPFVYFPYPLGKGRWMGSLGVAFTVPPRAVTEEFQYSFPRADLNVLRGLSRHIYLASRLTAQGLQNHLTIGPRYARPVSERISLSIGDDFGVWGGLLKSSQFNSQSFGFLNYPNVSLGYQVDPELLLTMKAEVMLNLYNWSKVGQVTTRTDQMQVEGVGLTMAMEQPFYGRKHLLLGFRALYTNFNWQFWSLFVTFDRRLFYPELFIGFYL